MYLQYSTGRDAAGHRRKITERKGTVARMIILIISNIIYWIVYNISLKMVRRTIESKLDSDPTYAERFYTDTMTFYENCQLALIGICILAKRFMIVADIMILIGAFFVFGPQ